MNVVILTAEEAEYQKCKQYFPEVECVRMGVGAGNVIRTCSALPEGTRVLNIGYAGSNSLPIGTVSLVSESYRLTDGTYQFEDHANPLLLCSKGFPCYTNNSFVTSTDKQEPTLFDMELNYICAFHPRITLLGSVKIVSDNLSVEAFENNVIRESGVLTSESVWSQVVELVNREFLCEQK